MIVPDSNLRRTPRAHPLLRAVLVSLLFAAAAWGLWLYTRIESTAHQDNARPADAIAVFGAAEYDGRPSPVLHARLDHTLDLYQRGLAPLVVSLGGGSDAGTDKDNPKSEGAVGRDYLIAHGVPGHAIIAETQSSDTEESVDRLALIARENHLRAMIVVSDGTHLFRIGQLCAADGLQVYTSPRPEMGTISDPARARRILHEMLSYTAWRLHLH